MSVSEDGFFPNRELSYTIGTFAVSIDAPCCITALLSQSYMMTA